MKIINTIASIPYPPLLDWGKSIPPEGWAEFPEAFVPDFYPPDKQAGGFVHITVEDVAHPINGDPADNIVYPAVNSCAWDEDAYQAYLSSLPEPEHTPTTDERVAALEAENKILAARVAAQSDQLDFYEDCIAEMAEIVYA